MTYVSRFFEGRRIWLNPMLVLICLIATSLAALSQEAKTTIYIVRHAERLDNSADSPLSQAGIERAKELAHVLKDANLTSIFVSNRLRTQQTAAPTAEITGIVPKRLERASDIVDAILSGNLGGQILVVGHSESLDNIAEGLGIKGVPELERNEYDRFFLVYMAGSDAHLHALRYGEPTD